MIRHEKEVVDRILEAMTRAIVAELAPDRVILFGSRARGDARADSDYDFAVEMPHDDGDSGRIHSRFGEAIRAVAPAGRGGGGSHGGRVPIAFENRLRQGLLLVSPVLSLSLMRRV